MLRRSGEALRTPSGRHRPLSLPDGAPQRPGGLPPAPPRARWRVRGKAALKEGDLLAHQIRRYSEHDWTRTTGGSDPKASRDELGQPVGTRYRGCPLSDRGIERTQVYLLKSLPSEGRSLDLPEQ